MIKREIPGPFYAAAGAGDAAYRKLRQLPDAATRTLRAAGDRATALRERVTTGQSRLNRDRLSADLTKLRDSAQRGYRDLVAHGERVVAARTAQGRAEPAEIATAVETAAGEVEPPAPGAAPDGPATGG